MTESNDTRIGRLESDAESRRNQVTTLFEKFDEMKDGLAGMERRLMEQMRADRHEIANKISPLALGLDRVDHMINEHAKADERAFADLAGPVERFKKLEQRGAGILAGLTLAGGSVGALAHKLLPTIFGDGK